MIDFHTGKVQPLSLPIDDHLLNLHRDLILIQRLELTIKANHRDQRTTITLEQQRIDSRPTPAGLGESLQCQHTQGGKVRAAVCQGRFMGWRPLSLPDVELLI
ncbi:hypothetical protein D3C85_1526380 [compost metagenome]